jgi:hypothetical protein
MCECFVQAGHSGGSCVGAVAPSGGDRGPAGDTGVQSAPSSPRSACAVAGELTQTSCLPFHDLCLSPFLILIFCFRLVKKEGGNAGFVMVGVRTPRHGWQYLHTVSYKQPLISVRQLQIQRKAPCFLFPASSPFLPNTSGPFPTAWSGKTLETILELSGIGLELAVFPGGLDAAEAEHMPQKNTKDIILTPSQSQKPLKIKLLG